VKTIKALCGTLSVALVLSFIFTLAFGARFSYAAPNNKYAAIVIDAKTGGILYQRNMNKKLHPASLTKMMTLFLTFEALDDGRIHLNDRVKFSRNAYNQAPSKLGLKPGETISVQNAILALVTKSANDVAVALAEKVGGSESGFVNNMNRKAGFLGMTQTHFENPHGLHNARQITTARDMAVLSRALMQYFPHHYHYFSTDSFAYNGVTYHNHNKLMKSYRGMDGLKTGYIAKSGFNLAASAVRDNRRLIGIVFGGRTSNSRNAHMRKILDDAFRNFGVGNQPPATIVVHNKVPPTPARKPDFGKTVLAQAEMERSGQITGQGDIDMDATPPSAVRDPANDLTEWEKKAMAAISPASGSNKNIHQWGIQVGAFKSRIATEQTLSKTMEKIGYIGEGATPVITPLKTDKGDLIFRARIVGMSSTQASKACRLLNDCLVLSVR